jgi:hypothetical protein
MDWNESAFLSERWSALAQHGHNDDTAPEMLSASVGI